MPANLDAIRKAFCEKAYRYKASAKAKLLKRGLLESQVEAAICGDAPRILHDYEDDPEGPCCLVEGLVDLALRLHVVVGYYPESWGQEDGPQGPLDVVTVYEPDDKSWHNARRD